MTYRPDLGSLNAHPIPAWYDDAKFGIFIHWGPFAIPAFATRSGSISDAFQNHYDTAVARTPYSEWYWNAIKVPESESAKYHAEVWKNAPYENFREPFLRGLAQWDPGAWARLFAEAGARYVVLVTKHHDGFCLWPSEVKNPHQKNWTTERDIVGELADAVRAAGMRFGVYYSGGIDWTFNREPLRTLADFIGSVPGGDYPAYAEAQTRELIERYKPSVLWNDISWPSPQGPMLKLFADYYNTIEDGVLNDRWMPLSWFSRLMRFKFARRILDAVIKSRMRKNPPVQGVTPPMPPHCDFRTPEYTTFKDIMPKKWEATRGMSHSFGYNRFDTDADYASVDSLVTSFIDSVAKNGNLLLNVGPRGEDAQIPPEQVARLQGFGAWLRANGEAIYGTRPFTRAEGRTASGEDVRFTARGNTVYAHVFGTPTGTTVTIEGTDLPVPARAVHVATGMEAACTRLNDSLALELPAPLAQAPAHAFRLESAFL